MVQNAGAHILGLKDMAGLLKPAAARVLIRALKDETGLPVHLHSHDTSGGAMATLLAAAEAGVDIVDAAMDAFAGGTSQPAMGTFVEMLRHGPRDTGLDPDALRQISAQWETVRAQYGAFECGPSAPASEVWQHEMPGGQYTNLRAQARAMGLEERWPEIAAAYAEANQIFGDIVKVTPSSKVVGDLALMMVSQGLSRAEVEDPAVEMAFPESVADMLRGNLGQPPGGWPTAITARVLKSEMPATGRPGALLPPADLEAERDKLATLYPDGAPSDEDLFGALMYPQVFADYLSREANYGPVTVLPTPIFFYGMAAGEEASVDLGPGKRLEIRLLAIGEREDSGEVRVFFELNGQPRMIRVPDRSSVALVRKRPKVTDGDADKIGAPMPGLVASVHIAAGQKVRAGALLLSLEAMKMETGLHAERDGTIRAVHVAVGDQVESRDLLCELEPAENSASLAAQ